MERFFLKKWLDRSWVLSHVYLLVVVCLGWVIFRYADLSLAGALLRGLFGLNGNALVDFGTQVELDSNLYLLLVAILASTPLAKKLKPRLEYCFHCDPLMGKVWDIVFYSVIPVVLLLLSTACLVGNSYNPFIYFQF